MEIQNFVLILIFLSVFSNIENKVPSFSYFWDKRSTKFEFINEFKFENNKLDCGTDFVVVDNIWYLFHRERITTHPPHCRKRGNSKIVVLVSVDRGKTFINKTDVALPNYSNIYSECAIVDGGGYFDEETTTWHYISQCIGKKPTPWCSCHYYRESRNPLGPWIDNPKNPGGDLFKKICSGPGKHCLNTTVDEGTPDIVQKIDGEFYVTFHGYEYEKKKAVRGVAATSDFVNWRVSGKNLPNDAIFSSIDCNNWNITWDPETKCVGGGEGSILVDGEYKYMLVEAPDEGLNCIREIGKQNWVLGLLRSKKWSISGSWEQFSVNPVVIPWRKQGCAIQYHRLFKDSEGFYLSFFIYGDGDQWGMKIFKLINEQGDLPIVADPTKSNP